MRTKLSGKRTYLKDKLQREFPGELLHLNVTYYSVHVCKTTMTCKSGIKENSISIHEEIFHMI